jgi:hypothetical protein
MMISLNHILFFHHTDHPIYLPMQLLNSPIIDEHYLIIHTFRGVTAHSSCVAGGVASPLLPDADLFAAEQTSWCSCSPHCSLSWAGNSYTHIKPQMTDNCNPHPTVVQCLCHVHQYTSQEERATIHNITEDSFLI